MTQQYSTEHLETHERLEPSAPIAPNSPTIQPIRRDRNRLLAFVLIGIGLALLARNISSGREQTVRLDLPFNGAQTVHLHVETGNGKIDIQPGIASDRLIGGEVAYRGDLLIDDDDADEADRSVRLRVERQGFLMFGSGSAADWDLQLHPQPRYNLELENGNGEVDLDLNSLQVERLDLNAGNGKVTVQLPTEGALEGEVDVGNGTLNLTLPADRALRLTLDSGNGSFNQGPLVQVDSQSGRDGVYETPDYARAPESERMELEVDSGNGTINVR